MRTVLCTFLVVFYVLVTHAQNVVFADPNLEVALLNNNFVNTNRNNVIELSEATSATWVFVRNANITNISGLENFVNATHIGISGNNITNLDLSFASKLEALDCDSSNVSNLTLSSTNTVLTTLRCSNNSITSIVFPTSLPKLKELDASNNSLSTLVLPNVIPDLVSIDVTNNQLTSLDLSNTVDLKDVWCNNNQLTSLNLPPLSNLATGRLREVTCRNNQFTSLHLQTPCLELNCGGNPLMDSLWVVGTSFSGEKVFCDSSRLVYIHPDREVEEIDCSHNKLETLGDILRQNSSLKVLNCSYNLLDTIITGHAGMTDFDCSHNKLRVVYTGNTPFVSNSFDSRNNPELYCISTPEYITARNSWKVDSHTVINDETECNSIWMSNSISSKELSCLLYPNPTTSNVQIDFQRELKEVNVAVYNALGQIVQVFERANIQQLEIVLPKEKGIYWIQIQTEKGRQILKSVKE